MDLELRRRSEFARPAPTGTREEGLSLVEAAMAAGLMMVVALALLPLFIRAVTDNTSGRESSRLTNFARSEIERYAQVDFFSQELTVADGSELVTDDYFSAGSHEWKDGTAPVADPAVFSRRVTVRQFSASALEDGVLEESEALDAVTAPEFVHFKEIAVAVIGERQMVSLGPASRITLRLVRSL